MAGRLLLAPTTTSRTSMFCLVARHPMPYHALHTLLNIGYYSSISSSSSWELKKTKRHIGQVHKVVISLYKIRTRFFITKFFFLYQPRHVQSYIERASSIGIETCMYVYMYVIWLQPRRLKKILYAPSTFTLCKQPSLVLPISFFKIKGITLFLLEAD